MQQLVTAQITRKALNRLELQVSLNNVWIPVEELHNPPYRLRIVQLLEGSSPSWAALVESLDSLAPTVPRASVTERLQEVESLRRNRLINNEEREARRQIILKDL
jgi:hypothetical protein